MKKLFFTILLGFATVHLFGSFALLPEKKPAEFKWMSLEEAEMACKDKPRKIFIDVYTDWCGWCKKMDKTTFQDSLVKAYAAEKFYAVKLNAEDKNNIIFREKVFKYNPAMQANDLAVMLLNGQMSYPSIVFLDEKLNPIQTFGSYLEAGQFHMILHYFGENAYRKKKSLDDFNQEFRKR